MYCSTCGGAVTKGLSYCNHCGEKLNRDERSAKSCELRPNLLVTWMVATFIFGMAIITMLLGMLRVVVGLKVEQVLLLGLLPFVLMVVLEAILITLLFRSTRVRDESGSTLYGNAALSGNNVLTEGQVTNELAAAQRQILSQPVSSVTEHTTRTFEPIYNDRRGSSE
jgi:branched-subunit amino acid transport protein